MIGFFLILAATWRRISPQDVQNGEILVQELESIPERSVSSMIVRTARHVLWASTVWIFLCWSNGAQAQSVSGVVVNCDGTPVAGAAVDLWQVLPPLPPAGEIPSNSTYVNTTTTNAAGVFTFGPAVTGGTGTYYVQAVCPDGTVGFSIVVDAKSPLALALNVHCHSLVGGAWQGGAPGFDQIFIHFDGTGNFDITKFIGTATTLHGTGTYKVVQHDPFKPGKFMAASYQLDGAPDVHLLVAEIGLDCTGAAGQMRGAGTSFQNTLNVSGTFVAVKQSGLSTLARSSSPRSLGVGNAAATTSTCGAVQSAGK